MIIQQASTQNHSPLYFIEQRRPSKDSTLSRIICASITPTVESTTPSTDVTPIFEALAITTHFTRPRYSSKHLQRVHTILFERDKKVSRLEQSLIKIAEESRTWQDRETKRNPSRRIVGALPNLIGSYSVVVFDVRRFEGGIKDHHIAAVYKSVLQAANKLTRGRKR